MAISHTRGRSPRPACIEQHGQATRQIFNLGVEYLPKRSHTPGMIHAPQADLDAIFSALAHPIRRALLESLSEGPDSVMNLAEPHPVSLNAVSKHLKTLEAAGLILRTRDRTFHRVRINPRAMRPAIEWMTYYSAFWTENLKSLKRQLEDQ